MHKYLALVATLALGTGASAQNAPTDIRSATPHSSYLQDGRGVVVRSGNGMCWRTGTWSPSDAVTGCDGALLPPVANPIAPPIVASNPPALAPAPGQVARCDFSATLGGDASFAFGRAALTPAARQQLDREVVARVSECSQVESILITGHADRLGSQQANQKLSEQRAGAVATYLKGKGIGPQIDLLGAGKSQPVKACSDKLPRAQLQRCLAPNRRVVIEVRGLKN
ncbi:MAG TPA: OmpA family protein [Noviherbaspirillum sp.]|uniref:OmpA family protein n=1 Tax=Noviherbaspirillum sp. TaxID=1926288 RepID=UPI002F93EEE4